MTHHAPRSFVAVSIGVLATAPLGVSAQLGENHFTSQVPGIGTAVLDFDQDGDLDTVGSGWFLSIDGNCARVHIALNLGSEGHSPLIPVAELNVTSPDHGIAGAGDVDGDGLTDLVLYDENSLHWVRGLGSALAPSALLVGGLAELEDVLVGDANADGDPDVFIQRAGLGWSLLRGQSGANFSAAIDVPLGGVSPRLLDFDGDGNLDFFSHASTTSFPPRSRLLVARNTGPGFTGSMTIQGTGDVNYGCFDAADVNGDGLTDMAIGRADGLWVFTRVSPTVLDPTPVQLSSAGSMTGVRFMDADHDGVLDLVAVASGARGRWFKGLGGGAFGAEQLLPPAVTGARELDVADVDGDGFEDLRVTAFRSRVTCFGTDGTSARPFEAVDLSLESNGWAERAFVADFDEDGHDDFVVGNVDGDVWLFLRRGVRGFERVEAVRQNPTPAVSEWEFLEPHDLDGDGHVDLVRFDTDSSELRVSLGRGDGTFGALILSPTGIGSPPFAPVSLADVNGDGHQDCLFTTSGIGFPTAAWSMAGVGDGTFAPAVQIATWTGSSLQGSWVEDMDLDGVPDLVLASGPITTPEVAWYPGLGGGAFGPASASTRISTYLWLRDVDSDGAPDLLSIDLTSTAAIVEWSRNLGGTFGAPIPIGALPGAQGNLSLLAEDRDGDGDLDILVAFRADTSANFDCRRLSTTVLFEGLGGGSFSVGVQVSESIPLQSWTPGKKLMSWIDADSDGDLDLAWASINGNSGWLQWDTGPPDLGVRYCTPAVINSAGAAAEISASGSALVADNDFTLRANDLPPWVPVIFIYGPISGSTYPVLGSLGRLCLTPPFVRLNQPGQLQVASLLREASLQLDLTTVGGGGISAGQTLNFQGWYRDSASGAPTSNFTDGLTVNFL
ncbi:FG-GAP repeat domain-containing protein [Saltatorellus ferox]